MNLENTLNRFNNKKDVIIILGPTASGKTGVAIEIAKIIGGEIISADSRTIYRGMDIGTAKPTIEEQQNIPHYGFDLVEPGERFTVADWKKYAEQKISEIKGRGRTPIIVGGTGLYIDALAFDYKFNRDSAKNSTTAEDRKTICSNYLLIGIKTEPTELRARITKRINNLYNDDLYQETNRLVKKYGWGSQAMKANIYQFVWRYLNGEISLEKAKELSIYDDWHLAKRQLTWFKRNEEIIWLPLAKITEFVVKYIQDEQNK